MAANKSMMTIIGTAQLPVLIADFIYDVKFQIVQEKMTYDIILGWNGFIKPNEGYINAKSETLTLKKPDQYKDGIAYLSKAVSLPPFTETFLTVVTNEKCQSPNIMVKLHQNLFSRFGIAAMPGIQSSQILFRDPAAQNCTEDRTINLILANMTSKAVELPAYTIVATVEPLESEVSIQAKSKYYKKVIQMLFDMEITRRKNCKTNSSQLNSLTSKQNKVIENAKLCNIRVDNDKLTAEQIKRVEELINNEFSDIFATNNKPSKTTKVSHFINTGDAKPTHCPPYRAS
jgi:hypothetical protein